MWQDKSDKVVRGVSTPPFKLDLADEGDDSLERKRFGGANRNIAKTATYAVMHFCVAIAVAFLLTGDVWIALSIGLIEPVVQTIAYALHEYSWSRKSRASQGAPRDRSAA